MRRRFEGGYARGGAQSLYVRRSDVIDILVMLIAGKFSIRDLLREAREELAERRRAMREAARVARLVG